MHLHACQLLCLQPIYLVLAGKTTVLNALAGQVPRTKGMVLKGNIQINSKPQAHAQGRQGYVQQEDVFFSQMTVR